MKKRLGILLMGIMLVGATSSADTFNNVEKKVGWNSSRIDSIIKKNGIQDDRLRNIKDGIKMGDVASMNHANRIVLKEQEDRLATDTRIAGDVSVNSADIATNAKAIKDGSEVQSIIDDALVEAIDGNKAELDAKNIAQDSKIVVNASGLENEVSNRIEADLSQDKKASEARDILVTDIKSNADSIKTNTSLVKEGDNAIRSEFIKADLVIQEKQTKVDVAQNSDIQLESKTRKSQNVLINARVDKKVSKDTRIADLQRQDLVDLGQDKKLRIESVNRVNGDKDTLIKGKLHTDKVVAKVVAVQKIKDDTQDGLIKENSSNIKSEIINRTNADRVHDRDILRNSKRIGELDNKIDGVENKMSKGIASAIATTHSIPMNLNKGEAGVGVGYGNFNGESAISLGLGLRATEDLTMTVSAGASQGDDVEYTVGAGASYKFNLLN